MTGHRPLTRGSRLAFALVAIAAVACSDSSTSPTPSTPETTSEVFSSTITQSGTSEYPFTVKTTGPLSVSLTSVEPLPNMSLGVSIGGWNGTTCATAFTKNDNARAGAAALSGEVTAGDYCVSVYDSGNIAAEAIVSFSAEIVHP